MSVDSIGLRKSILVQSSPSYVLYIFILPHHDDQNPNNDVNVSKRVTIPQMISATTTQNNPD